MKQSSQSSEPRRLSKDEFALRAVLNVMYALGVSVNNVDEAYQAIDLAAKVMTYVLGRKVKPAEIKASLAKLMEEEIAERSTKH